MPKLTGTFAAAGEESLELAVPAGGSYVLSLTPDPSLTGSIVLLQRTDSLAEFTTVATYTDTQALTEYQNTASETVYLRLRCVAIDDGVPEDVDYVLQSLISTGTRKLATGSPKVGATAGWTVRGATDVGTLALCPASQTASTLVVPLDFLAVGDVITGFYPVGQVESAGNTASLTVNLRKLTAAAADLTDASVATSGSVSYTADALLGRITQPVENLSVTVADGESYYFLLTATTAASTDIALQGVMVALA